MEINNFPRDYESRQRQFLPHARILGEICKGDKTSLEALSIENPKFHWTSIISPRTKESPLHLAAQYGHEDVMLFLLNKFYPKLVDVRNVDNKTPLHVAAQFGRLKCVKILVENGADINAIKRSDWTPLMLACTKPENCYEKIVDYLIEKGSILNFKNKDGWNCLHLASRNENSSILQAILKTNIDTKSLTKNGRTALHISALHGNLENLKVLSKTIDINSVDFSGNVPLHEAVLGGNIEVIDFLLSNGSDIFSKNKTGSNILHLAAGNGSNNVIMHLVDKYKLDLDEVDSNGHTSLHYAARKNHSATFRLLIALGAKSQILDTTGRLASDYNNT